MKAKENCENWPKPKRKRLARHPVSILTLSWPLTFKFKLTVNLNSYSGQLGKLLRETRKRYFRRETVFNSPTSSPEPEKRETQNHDEETDRNSDLKSEYPSITLHSHVELHKIGQKPQIIWKKLLNFENFLKISDLQ